MTSLADMTLTVRLFRQALDLVRSAPLPDTDLFPALGGWPAPPPAASSPPRAPVEGRPDDLWALGKRLRTGATSISDVAAACAAVIDRHGDRLGAYVHVADTHDEIAALSAEAKRGMWRSALHGVPLSVKDVIHVAGMPTGGGSHAYPVRVAPREGEAVRRLRAAGVVLNGKVATHEFALGVTTPQSRNPWDDSRIPGGSSGGSAISVVTGMAYASLGTDTRASIRVPAALSGTVGFKPSFGRVPVDGLVTLSWSIDHIAPMGRSVRDIALLMDVLTASEGTYRNALPGALTGKRLRYSPALVAGAEPGVAATFRAALTAAESAGAIIEELTAPTADDLALANAAGMIVSRCEAASYHREAGADLDRCTSETEGQLREALEVRAADYLRAQRLRALLRARLRATLDGADAFVMPTAKVVAPPVEEADSYLLVLSETCIPWSFVDFPAISLPMGMVDGLPTGLQLVGRPAADLDTLGMAYALERVLPALPTWSGA